MNDMTYFKATHYSVILSLDDGLTPKYRLFEYTDITRPNKLVFSTNSHEEFQIKIDLIGLSEIKETNKNVKTKIFSISYYH